jgi:hypothetical protein
MNAAPRPVTDQRAPTWAQARLRLGITNVGFWVIVSVLVIALRPAAPAGPLGWMAVVAALAAVQAPFDWVGGRWLPSRHGRPVAPVGAIARGVLVQSSVWILYGLALMGAASLGWVAVVCVFTASMGAMVAGQARLAGLVAHLPTEAPSPEVAHRLGRIGLDPSSVRVVHARDRAFVGAWTGLPGRERLMVPARWFSALPPDHAEVALLRRVAARRTGARSRGLLAAAAWTVTGFVLVTLVPGAGLDTPAALLVTGAGGTLWSFVGLLTLPTYNRRAVFAVDHAVADEVGAPRVTRAIARLDEDQEDEERRSETVEHVFHPVPSPANRQRALRSDDAPRPGAWTVARTALYLGWLQFSWLSRAVHCNAGRPELWVLFPGD